MKRTREGSSQTYEEDADAESQHGIHAVNERLTSIEEKLNVLLQIMPELEGYKRRITDLEEENRHLKESLENAHAEIKDLASEFKNIHSEQNAASSVMQRVENDLLELRRRHIKLECHSRRGNLKFFGINEREDESNTGADKALREFMRCKLKIPPSDVEQIQFDRVHRISTRVSNPAKVQGTRPRPIIVKLTQFQDKEFIKSFIKNLPKGSCYGISDDFPKEVDDVRKKLYPILKAAKNEKKTAYFSVERLIINGTVYRGPETTNIPFYGRLMSN